MQMQIKHVLDDSEEKVTIYVKRSCFFLQKSDDFCVAFFVQKSGLLWVSVLTREATECFGYLNKTAIVCLLFTRAMFASYLKMHLNLKVQNPCVDQNFRLPKYCAMVSINTAYRFNSYFIRSLYTIFFQFLNA